MLHIDYEEAPTEIKNEIATIKSTPEWRSANTEDTAKLRGFFDDLSKDVIREALINRQHGLCAYCMSRIENNHTTRLEHVKPLSADKNNALDFNNIIAVCHGGACMEGKHRVLCCDAAKGDNELKYLSPFNDDIEESLKYDRYGYVKCCEKHCRYEDIEFDIGILNLNGKKNKPNADTMDDTCTRLRAGRKYTWKAAELFISNLNKRNQLTPGRLEHEIKRLMDMNPRNEYVGVSLYVYKREQSRLQYMNSRKHK